MNTRPLTLNVALVLFLLLTAFVGVNQWLYVLVGACPASAILKRACSLRSAIYPSGEGSVR